MRPIDFVAETIAGITYSKPIVLLLQETGIGTSEYAARTAYNSFEASENYAIRHLIDDFDNNINRVNNIEHSDLLDSLAWVHHHHSVLEHASLTYLIKGTSRGVLQEHARHRIQSLTVRSTRYTMSSLINCFVAEIITNPSNTNPSDWFIYAVLQLDMFVTTDISYNKLQVIDIYRKLKHQYLVLGNDEFFSIALSKDALTNGAIEQSTPTTIFNALEASKKKKNVGDSFKHIVNDTWKVDMVITMNLRALKNYLVLRDSGAAYFGIRHLAQAIKEATPSKYLNLIVKESK